MKHLYIILAILIVALLASCDPNPGEYEIGDRGPAGGWIFYDCDADNDSGNADGLTSEECGWRYLEAAPKDVVVGEREKFVFGFFKYGSSYRYINGSSQYSAGSCLASDGLCTGTAVGTGAANTEKLNSHMSGYNAYTDISGNSRTHYFAAGVCDSYKYKGYEDWFLPSSDELNLMFRNLGLRSRYKFSNASYWSSSESPSNYCDACYQYFGDGSQYRNLRNSEFRVRAVRAFK